MYANEKNDFYLVAVANYGAWRDERGNNTPNAGIYGLDRADSKDRIFETWEAAQEFIDELDAFNWFKTFSFRDVIDREEATAKDDYAERGGDPTFEIEEIDRERAVAEGYEPKEAEVSAQLYEDGGGTLWLVVFRDDDAFAVVNGMTNPGLKADMADALESGGVDHWDGPALYHGDEAEAARFIAEDTEQACTGGAELVAVGVMRDGKPQITIYESRMGAAAKHYAAH